MKLSLIFIKVRVAYSTRVALSIKNLHVIRFANYLLFSS